MKYFLIIASFLLVHNAVAQDSSFTLVKTYTGDIANAAMDNLENLYIISSTGQIRKYNAGGDSMGVYSQVRNFGQLYSIDVSNPLKILLFYKDFSTVVVLDRFLAVVATVDLRKFSILQPGAIGLSYDNNILVYDEYDNRLKKIDEQGNKLLETAEFRTIFTEPIAPQKIISDNGLVYLADTASGVFVFDNYGTFKRKLPVMNWQSIAVVNNNLVSTRDDMITVYNPATLMEIKRKFPFFKPYLQSFTHANKFVTLSPNQLQVYQFRY